MAAIFENFLKSGLSIFLTFDLNKHNISLGVLLYTYYYYKAKTKRKEKGNGHQNINVKATACPSELLNSVLDTIAADSSANPGARFGMYMSTWQ